MALLPTKKISALAPITPPLTGDEELECVQLGNSRKATTRAFVLPSDSLLTFSAMGGFLPGSRQVTAGIGIALVDGGPGTTLEINATGAVAGPANPTASVGLAVVNGAAVTYMRSDAAPALSQAIAPTWTGQHLFALAPISQGTGPRYDLDETDAAVDNRRWQFAVQGEQLRMRVANDALGVVTNFMTVDRTGTVIDLIDLLATTVQVNGVNVRDASNLFNTGTVPAARLPGSFSGLANPTASLGLAAINGAATTAMRSDAAPALSQAIAPTWTAQHIFSLSGATNSAILVSSAQPQIDWNETDAAANNRRWRFETQGEQFLGRTVNDANSAAVTWIAVDRTLNVVDAIALTSTALTWNGNPISTAVGANPTVSLGLAAVNGVATTFMRSDAAPALSQAIAPTWTSKHIFTAIGDFAADVYAVSAESTAPFIGFNETDAAVNNRRWAIGAAGEQFGGYLFDDDGSPIAQWMTVDRTGAVVDKVAFPASALNSFLVGTSSGPSGFSALAHMSLTTNNVLALTSGATGSGLVCHSTPTVGDNAFVAFGTEASFTQRGSITYNRGAGLVAYNTTSDARRKKNIRDSNDSGEIIDRIRVRAFDWTESDTHVEHWFIAQELHAVMPMAVAAGSENRDWAIDPSKLIPLMIKELQSVRSRMQVLEARPAR